MSRQYRFGDVQHRSRGKHKEYSINAITPKLERDANGNLIPYRTPRFKLNLVEVYNLLSPYVLVRMMEQVKAVVPLALYLLLFQVLILRQLEAHYLIITG